MKYLDQALAVLQAIAFILTWRVRVKSEDRETAKELEKEADEAIRTGRFNDVISVWTRMRNL